MVTQIGRVPRLERIRECHNNHVPALFKRHGLVVTVRVTGSIGVVRANVMHGVGIGIVSGFLNLVKRLQQEQQQLWVRVKENGMRRENDIDRVHVAVGRDLLHKQVGLLNGTGQLGGRKSLTTTKRSDGQIILAGSSNRITDNLIIKFRRQLVGFLVVMIKEVELAKLALHLFHHIAVQRLTAANPSLK